MGNKNRSLDMQQLSLIWIRFGKEFCRATYKKPLAPG